MCKSLYAFSKLVFVVVMSNALPKCYTSLAIATNWILRNGEKTQNKLMFFIYTKVFSFPTLHLQRGGVKHYHHGKKDKKWSVILRLTKYDFLLGS
jgi:hypothetical protein